MPSVTLVPSLDGKKKRLIVDGGWSAEADRAVSRGGFDRLELQRGQYFDLRCLVPHSASIVDLWINGLCKTTVGLECLSHLETLQLGYPADKNLDFRCFASLRSVVLEHWKEYYGSTLFACEKLETLSIDGYSEPDCERFASLRCLESLSLIQGKVESLIGLDKCGKLTSLVASNCKRLSNIDAISKLPGLIRLELREKLPSVGDLRPIFGLDELQYLDLRGCDVTLPTLQWLSGKRCLQVALVPRASEIDWSALFRDKPLKKLWLALESDKQATPNEAAEQAAGFGLVPIEAKRLGKGRNSALLLRFA